MEKATLVATGLMILLYIFLEYFGIIQHGVKLTAFYFQFLKNDYLLILSLALSASIVLLPASLYLFALQKSIKEMMEYFQVIQQKHKNCCCPSDRRFCKTYFQELRELRKSYKNINQTIVIGAILYQVAALGFFFRVVNHINLPDPSFVIIDSVSLTKWTLLFLLTIILLIQFWSYFTKIFKKQGYTQKFISLSLIVISIFWMATFQLCEMLFLFILVLIQLMGSALLKKLSYSRQK